MPTVAWLLLAGLGFWLLRTVPRARNLTLKAVMVRLAAVLFLVAGTVSAGGVVGSGISWFVHATGAIGAGIAWVAWLVLALSWLAGMVPERWFGGDVPDWLSVSGMVLPALLASVPGAVGTAITAATQSVASGVGAGLGAAFGIHA
jgi:hypothetical protein